MTAKAKPKSTLHMVMLLVGAILFILQFGLFLMNLIYLEINWGSIEGEYIPWGIGFVFNLFTKYSPIMNVEGAFTPMVAMSLHMIDALIYMIAIAFITSGFYVHNNFYKAYYNASKKNATKLPEETVKKLFR